MEGRKRLGGFDVTTKTKLKIAVCVFFKIKGETVK